MDKAAFEGFYSVPLGTGAQYPRPPFIYRDVEDCIFVFETEREGAEALLPPGVEIADEVPICMAWARWVPFSTFGPYTEAYLMIRARFAGRTYLYQPLILVDNVAPLTAGREKSGFHKKLAYLERSWGGDETFGEQLLFTVERPRGQRIMTASMACDRLADPGELEDLPVLSTKFVPHTESDKPPAVAELVELDSSGALHRSADGTPKFWAGRGSLRFDAISTLDPWYLLAPTRILQCFYAVLDFEINDGKVVHDYLEDEAMWR